MDYREVLFGYQSLGDKFTNNGESSGQERESSMEPRIAWCFLGLRVWVRISCTVFRTGWTKKVPELLCFDCETFSMSGPACDVTEKAH